MQQWGHVRQKMQWQWASTWEMLHPTHTWKEPPATPEAPGEGVKHQPSPTLTISRDSFLSMLCFPSQGRSNEAQYQVSWNTVVVHLLTEPINIRNWETLLKMHNKPTSSCLWYTRRQFSPWISWLRLLEGRSLCCFQHVPREHDKVLFRSPFFSYSQLLFPIEIMASGEVFWHQPTDKVICSLMPASQITWSLIKIII